MEHAIEHLGIHDAMERAGMDTAMDIMTCSASELCKRLGIQEFAAQQLLDAAAKDIYPWRQRRQMANEGTTSMLTTGDAGMDRVLSGGILLGTITEVVGESASGKTQLCLQLCLAVQRPLAQGGLGGEAVYLHSEGRFPSVRLEQLVTASNDTLGTDPTAASRAIHTMYLRDRESQYRVLAYQLPAFLERHPRVRLVVIDSISATYRGEARAGPADRAAAFDKMAELCAIGVKLKSIAHRFRVAIVTVNQVADVADGGKTDQANQAAWLDFRLPGLSLGLFVNSLVKTPVLGLAWSHAVTTRLRLARSLLIDGHPTRRVLFVEFSPLVPRRGCEIIICSDGVHGLPVTNDEQ